MVYYSLETQFESCLKFIKQLITSCWQRVLPVSESWSSHLASHLYALTASFVSVLYIVQCLVLDMLVTQNSIHDCTPASQTRNFAFYYNSLGFVTFDQAYLINFQININAAIYYQRAFFVYIYYRPNQFTLITLLVTNK